MSFFEAVSQSITTILFAVFLALTILFYQERQQTFFLWCFLLAWVFGFGSVGVAITIWMKHHILLEPELHGFLIPANDPSPVNPCQHVPQGALSVYFGNSVAFGTMFPASIINVAGEELLAMNKTEDGISISCKVFSRDSRVVAEIIDNEFHINANNYFRKKRPDAHSLTVYDEHGRKILHVRYLNPSAVKVLGIFSYAGHPIIIQEDFQRIGPSRFERQCIGDNLGAAINLSN